MHYYIQRSFRVITSLCCFILLSACLPTTSSQRAIAPEEAKAAWYAFVARTELAEKTSTPFRINGSLRYVDKNGDSNRVSTILWGNGSPPLRLDLRVGFGTVVAKIQEANGQLLAFLPEENIAFTHHGYRSLASFGVPVPFSLSELTLILTGRSGLLFLPMNASPQNQPSIAGFTNKGVLFAVPSAPLSGTIELAANGSLLGWEDNVPGGWKVQIESEPATPLVPKRIFITHGQGYEAQITVKDIETLDATFAADQLTFTIPETAKIKSL